MSNSNESRLPSPALPPLPDPSSGSAPTLEELLEQASQTEAARLGGGTLVGECLDTHNPHLPYRVLVRARGEDGKQAAVWLPILAQLRIRPGDKLLLSKPDNWPEPVVVGVLRGLESADTEPPRSEPTAREHHDPELRLEPGQAVIVSDARGVPLLAMREGEDGPRIELLHEGLALDMPGKLQLEAERIELHARAGGVDIRSDADAVVRSRIIRLN